MTIESSWLQAARPRRLRTTDARRKLVRETRLAPENFVYPLFVTEGKGVKDEIPSMPGIHHFSVDLLGSEIEEVQELGIPAVLLFGLPDRKDEFGSEAYNEDGIVQRAVRGIRELSEELVILTDVCLCQYTNHGHCGVVKDGEILNDESLELLAKTAVSHAEAGADFVGPSAMMDHQVGALRKALDFAGFQKVGIMSYSAKYASSLYGPFREAVDSAPSFGDRRSYQMDPANAREALVEMKLDIEEGADILMVKPALFYLDIVKEARQRFDLPIAAYNVSGEYAMIRSAAAQGLMDGERSMMEALTSIKRAGADLIITYFAKSAAKLLGSTRE
jgi:porphobilinogen synthase